MTVRRFLALGVVAWGCAAPPVFTPIVVFESETLAARADRVEVFVTSAPCPDRTAAAAVPPVQPNGFVLGPRVLRRGEVGAAFGDVPYDATAYLWARAFDECAVIAAGCTRVDLAASVREVRVTLSALGTAQGRCGAEPGCDAGRCTTPLDAGSSLDATLDAGSSLDATLDAGSSLDATLDAGSSFDATLDAGSSLDATVDTTVDALDRPLEAGVPTDVFDAREAAVSLPDVVVSCAAPRVLCNGACVLLGTDQNCRACGHVCAGRDVRCCGGSCIDVSTNNNHCGACDNRCGGRKDRCCNAQCRLSCP